MVSSYYNVCLRGSAGTAGAINLRSTVDFAYGTIPYKNTVVNVYIGNHPDVGSYGELPPVRATSHTTLVYEGPFNTNQYLYVYGYMLGKTFGDHHVEMPVYIRLQVQNVQRQRSAAYSLGGRLVPCPNHLVKNSAERTINGDDIK